MRCVPQAEPLSNPLISWLEKLLLVPTAVVLGMPVRRGTFRPKACGPTGSEAAGRSAKGLGTSFSTRLRAKGTQSRGVRYPVCGEIQPADAAGIIRRLTD